MKVLLDTHVWIWWLLGSTRLSARERSALDRLAARSDLGVAAVSLWEAQMLHSKGRLVLDRPFATWLRDAAAAVAVAPLDADVVIALEALPPAFHGDPADRLIVATAVAKDCRLATHDRAVRRSSVVRAWAP